MDYQLIVIGAGPGGDVAALRAAKLGLKVAVVENREAGGTCLNRGCVPTKTLLHSSQLYYDIRNGAHCGITAEDVNVNLEAIFANKRAICEKLSAGIEGLFKSAKIDLLRGTGKIQLAHVASAQGTACVEMLCGTENHMDMSVVSSLKKRHAIGCLFSFVQQRIVKPAFCSFCPHCP